ncbi:MAG: 16S rRNA (uracil(1498)-N(3))-methyltransferase [Bacteroidetes bacterium]|nr:16S rRNA (uracil(1498)-N(3))-methyltransferase [Bacteroidota bacterium]MBU2505547.1 16S rRNA (uracil(1498)-N(3))-methyltransferase [Bacteroidota bacterium]
MERVFLSDIELYYSENVKEISDTIAIEGEEANHIINVMRHKIDDEIYVTTGIGRIYRTQIISIAKKKVDCKIFESYRYTNIFENIYFCLPRLKSADRFEFALEKCIELGITNFIVFESERCIAKGEKIDRWNKIAISAMKQSLRSFKSKINYSKSITDVFSKEGRHIVFDQNSEVQFIDFLRNDKLISESKGKENINFYFGPEGGLTENELSLFSQINKFRLTNNRLRSETAIITAASIISSIYS